MSSPVDLGLGVLDHALVDSEGRRCGKVDDLELEGVRDGDPRVAAILSGPSAWRGRGRLGRLAAAVARGRSTRIAWEEVAGITSAVELRRGCSELRLGAGDDRAGRLLDRVPGSSL
jgi:hypothetical protein